MTPKSIKMASLGPQGAIWGSHGAHQMPQDRVWLQFGTRNDPKMHQNDPKINQNGTIGISGSPSGEPWVPQEAPRPILYPTGSPNEPKINKNGSQTLKIKHQCLKKRGSAALAKPSDKSAAPWPCARRVRRAGCTSSLQDLPGPKDLLLTLPAHGVDPPHSHRLLTFFWLP